MSITVGSGVTLGAGITVTTIPEIVLAGLIVNLDAGNTVSYSGSGSTWVDISGAANDATLIGTTPWTSAGAQSSFTFNNGAGYAQGGAILPNTTYTKVAIFKCYGSFVNLISGDSANQHAFWGGATPYLVSGHNGAWYTISSANPAPTNQWVFSAVSFSNVDGWRLYLNNQPPVTNADTSTFSANPAVVEYGGFDGNANNLNGDIAVALIYNRVLSDVEIAQLYAHYAGRFIF